ncbi:MAG: nickel pincer cofactor biosynthesis protein LarC [Promethearchaeota archaeon]
MKGTRCLYIDAKNSGISGDMFLASLLELALNSERILNQLRTIPQFLSGVSKFEIGLLKTERRGLKVNQLEVKIKEKKNHRTANVLRESLEAFLNSVPISSEAKHYAKNVLLSLINAEVKVHGKDIENLHLHELSSIDTLLDIAGVALALDDLKLFENEVQIYCSTIPLGGGIVKTAHGMLPVPAPATVKIIENSGLRVEGGPIDSELVTPTGAALLANLKPKFKDHLPRMRVEKIGQGCGQKKFQDFLNVLRLYHGVVEKSTIEFLGIARLKNYIEEVAELETDVDDVSGEILGNFIKLMEKENILDIQVIPALTKKNRPSHVIKILCKPDNVFEIIEKMMEELGTLGVRFHVIERVCIDRTIKPYNILINETQFQVKHKISFLETIDGKKIINMKPEYEDLKKISNTTKIPIKKLQRLLSRQVSDDDFSNNL